MRASDLSRLLLLQRPIRCHVCLHRSYVNILLALALRGKNPGTPRVQP
ncbi:MAG: hypothetical protein WBE76_00235 [Terracidiphilus sp.]